MSTFASDPSNGDWECHNLDSSLEPEFEKVLDSENIEQPSESEHFDLRIDAEKGDCLDFTPEFKKGEHTFELQKGNYKFDSEKDKYKSEPEKGDVKTESEDSDLESDRSQAGSDLYDRLNDLQATGCGDGIAEPSIPVYDDSRKNSATIRRGRAHRDSDPAFKESSKNELLADETTDFQKEELPCDIYTGPKLATSNTFVPPVASFRDWYKYVTPKTMCLILLSLIYLGFTIFGIKVLNFSANST